MKSKFRSLQVQSLEKREVMAGNVSVSFSGTTLNITGDGNANGVDVRQVSPGKYLIYGEVWGGNNTKINGGGSIYANNARDVVINLGGGSDKLEFGIGDLKTISVPGNLTVRGEAGNDIVNMRDVKVGGNLMVSTGTGIDKTYVNRAAVGNNLLLGDASPVNNGDRDEATVLSCNVRNQITFISHQGNDRLEISSSTADSVYASMENGNDFFRMDYTNARWWSINGGNGYDTFYSSNARYGGSGFEVVKRY